MVEGTGGVESSTYCVRKTLALGISGQLRGLASGGGGGSCQYTVEGDGGGGHGGRDLLWWWRRWYLQYHKHRGIEFQRDEDSPRLECSGNVAS